MAKFRIRIASADSRDIAQYDKLAAVVKRAGFQAMSCGSLAELTQDQMADKQDSWVRFTAMNAGVTKFVETSLVNGVISKSHIEKNAALLAEKSKVLARHGLKGYFYALEPQWLPESFYARQPEVRGPRVDHPGVARSKYYAPCLDRPEVLAHYREATRKLLELAPELAVFSIWTNDSGGGICWCTGLYSGRNGPEYCREVPFAERIRKWLRAILAGAADAGRQIEAFLRPVHFSPDETYTTLGKLPARTRFVAGTGAHPNEPFIEARARKLIQAAKDARRPAVMSLDPMLSYPLGPIVEAPVPFFVFDLFRAAAACGAEGVIAGGVTPERGGADTMPTLAVTAALARPPKSNETIEKAVLKVAKAQVGQRLAGALTSAWRDVDYALRIWPLMSDPEHMLYPFYSTMGARWIVRPIVPVPERLTEQDKAYFSQHRHGGRDPRTENKWFMSESRDVYAIEEYKWVFQAYGVMLAYLERALSGLEAALAGTGESAEKANLAGHYRRIAILRAVWRTTRNVFQCGSIIEHFTSPRRAEFEERAPTFRRVFLEGIEDEIANSRETVRLIRESPEPLIATGEVESSFVLPRNLAEQIEKKIALMESHRADIDVLFPNCPPEVLKDETYEETDKKLKAEGK